MTTGILPANQLLERLKSGRTAVGTMVGTFAQSSMPVLLANAGFDFFLLDNEHGMFDYETMETLCRVAVGQGITPIVRPADHTYTWTAKVLDTGAQGLLMPRVYTVEQVRSIISMAKYPPEGIRGSALSRAYVGYKNANAMEVMAEANEQSMLCIQIETRESYAVRDEIAALPEVDCLFVGPNDFSISLGHPGNMDHPDVTSAIENVLDTCRQFNKVAGIQMNTPESACRWARAGFNMLSAGSDVGLLQNAGQALTGQVRDAWN